MSDTPTRDQRLATLEILVGEWVEQVLLPDAPAGRAVFEWALRGAYLIQRSDAPLEEFPDGFMVIEPDPDGDGYTQHYFDSRGVTRVYRMQLRDGEWTLLRTEPDFSPLGFAQRFQGTFSADGDTIEGRWETSHDGGTTWETDFGLRYTRVR
jgi:hypothetical protein